MFPILVPLILLGTFSARETSAIPTELSSCDKREFLYWIEEVCKNPLDDYDYFERVRKRHAVNKEPAEWSKALEFFQNHQPNLPNLNGEFLSTVFFPNSKIHKLHHYYYGQPLKDQMTYTHHGSASASGATSVNDLQKISSTIPQNRIRKRLSKHPASRIEIASILMAPDHRFPQKEINNEKRIKNLGLETYSKSFGSLLHVPSTNEKDREDRAALLAELIGHLFIKCCQDSCSVWEVNDICMRWY